MEIPDWKNLEQYYSNDGLLKDEHWKNDAMHIMDQMTNSKSDVAKQLVLGNLLWEEFIMDQFGIQEKRRFFFFKERKVTNMNIELPPPKTLFDMMCMTGGVMEAASTLKDWGRSDCADIATEACSDLFKFQ